MFEQHFGLSGNPFDGGAEGSGVFLSPRATDLLRRVNKIFASPDAVLCVSGPVGSGKTTLVGRALSALGRQHTIVRVGRLKLGPDEVLDYLLRELGLKQMPAGTIQKISVFRSILEKLERNDIRLFIVVEDAARLGNVALQELEVLTATDSGVSDGANLVLMAENEFAVALETPGLRRLRQRVRLHSTVYPMTAAETRAYVHHAISKTGGEPSDIVTDDAVEALHLAAAGIPRMVNNLISSALESAAEQSARCLEAPVLVRIANEEFGIDIEGLPDSPFDSTSEVRPVDEEAPQSDWPADADDTVDSECEAQPLAAAPAGAADTEPDALPEVAAIETGEHPIPDLIQDTFPNLDGLAPGMQDEPPALFEEPPDEQSSSENPAWAGDPEPAIDASSDDVPLLEPTPESASIDSDAAPEPAPLSVLLTETEDDGGIPETDSAETIPALDEDLLPTLDTELTAPESMSDDGEIPTLFDTQTDLQSPLIDDSHADPECTDPPVETPAWERNPTLAELRPDLKALERAMAAAQGDNEEPAPIPVVESAVEDSEEVPEIILDESIRRKIDIAEAALKATQTLEEGIADSDADPVPDVDAPAAAESDDFGLAATADEAQRTDENADPELDRISAELARAKSIEDVDDKLAETLFGEEFSMIAAEVAASVGTLLDGNEEPDSAAEEEAPFELSLADNATEHAENEQPHMATGDHDKDDVKNLERQFHDPQSAEAVEVSMETTPTGLSMSATQRLATVRALNAANAPAANSDLAPPRAKGKSSKAPDSIENQINVSITQTLTSLDPAAIKQMQEAEAENEDKKTGFFGRFRRSRPS
jgi:type II secretory pathway predicted ATPase ExeA